MASAEAADPDGAPPARLSDVLEGLTAGDDGADLTLGDVLDALGDRSLGPLLFVPSLIAVMPGIGAIPGISWTMATLIIVVAGQYLFHARTLWLPAAVRGAPINRRLLGVGVASVAPGVRWAERFVRPRLSFLASGPATYVVALACVAMALVMFALSLLPGAIVPPALGVLVFAIGLTGRDGLVIAVGFAACGGAVALAAWLLT